ncbi:phage holin family protein [Erythrobacter sp. GH1-10]|uniref:phage holin family protein n=1 Tax=Erythrobacter sp. GH1-10 TaxID=3349334 RepID=UPI003877C1B8
MRDDDRPTGREQDAPEPSASDDADASSDIPESEDEDFLDESLTEELAALLEDGRTYAEAELAFQKTRAKLAGKNVGSALGLLTVAIITLHIAVLALAVGLVIALEPLVTIWGAIGIVVGVLLLLTVMLALAAKSRIGRLNILFGSDDDT